MAAQILKTSALLVFAGTLCAVFPAAPETSTPPPEHKPFFAKPLGMGAHRGGCDLWPEGTLDAFKAAAAKWPDVILESDAHMTQDGQIVLLHDEAVDRTTDGTGPVAGKTLAEVKALDAGYRFSPDKGTTFPYRGKGLTIPTLAEILAALPDARFLIELKSQLGIAEPAVEVIERAHAEDRVLLASFNPDLMARVRKKAPRIATCYDIPGGLAMIKTLREGDWAKYRRIGDVLAIDENMIRGFKLTPDDFRAFHAKGIFISVHTIDEPDRMRALLDMGADLILSDRPDLLADVLKARR